MELTTENVERVFKDCLFKDEEIKDGTPEYVAVKGIMHQFGFHPERLESHREDVRQLLSQLPESFLESKGGGHSFINACVTQDGTQWGEHMNMEQLFVLGVGLELARGFELPGMSDADMPVPYFVVLDQEQPQTS